MSFHLCTVLLHKCPSNRYTDHWAVNLQTVKRLYLKLPPQKNYAIVKQVHRCSKFYCAVCVIKVQFCRNHQTNLPLSLDNVICETVNSVTPQYIKPDHSYLFHLIFTGSNPNLTVCDNVTQTIINHNNDCTLWPLDCFKFSIDETKQIANFNSS